MGVLRGPHRAERPWIVWHHLHVLGSPPPQGPSPSLCGHHQLPLEEGACEGCSPRPSVGWWRPARDLRGLRSTAASPRPGRDVSDGRVGQSQPAREPRCSNERRTGCRKRKSKEEKKVNCKPKNQDEQEIPFRLREIMRSQQEMKNPLSNKKRKKEAQVAFRRTLEKEAKGAEPDIVVPKFKQRKGESDGAYIQRMEQEAQYVMFLSKNQASRQPEVQVAPKKEKSERKKSFQKRRLDKARQKKEAKAADRLEQELLQDTVKFGEVVLQPPELTAKPRRSEPRDQPGQKSLMLRKLLSPSSVSQPLTTSMARQRILQEERERAVRAYRALKKQQQQGTLPPPRPGRTHSTLEAQS